jgi:hypothetical protein
MRGCPFLGGSFIGCSTIMLFVVSIDIKNKQTNKQTNSYIIEQLEDMQSDR